MQKNKEPKVDRKYILSEYFGFLKNYKMLFFLTFLFVALHEIKQIADKFVLKLVMDKAELYLSGAILLNVFSKFLLIIAFVFLGLIMVSVISNWLKIHFLNRLDAKMIFDLKKKYFNHILSLDHKFFSSHKTGSLISRLTRGGGAMERMNDSLVFEFAPLIIQAIVLIVTLVYLDILSAIVITIIFAVFLSFNLYYQKKIDLLNKRGNDAEDFEKGNVADIFTNVDSIKYFGKEEMISNKYKKMTSSAH